MRTEATHQGTKARRHTVKTEPSHGNRVILLPGISRTSWLRAFVPLCLCYMFGTALAAEITTNSIGMKLALISHGEFDMGSPADQKGHEDDEALHRVRISKPFRMGVTEVTQAQWRKVMGARSGAFQGDDLPVESISFADALEFCKKLSKLEGRTYRLPTEAEWEYACRAGAQTPWAGDVEEMAWFDDNADGRTHPVGVKKPNAWGLHDMHGNVAEWCADYYGAYPSATVIDPTGPATGKARVVRGGSFANFPRGLRSSSRGNVPASYQLKTVGLRVVAEP